MSWVYLDDKFHSNQKVLEIGNSGAGLFARALSYCGDHLTDGYVPIAWARIAGSAKLRDKLTDVGLWIEVKENDWYEFSVKGEAYKVEIPGVGYFIPDYLLLNPSKARVLDKRNKRAEAGRAGADARWHNDGTGDGKAMANAIGDRIDTASQPQCPPTPTPPQELPTPLTPLPGGQGSDESFRGTTLDKLLAFASGNAERQKVMRAYTKHRPSEHRMLEIVGMARGRDVRDPLAIVLSELKKRRAA